MYSDRDLAGVAGRIRRCSLALGLAAAVLLAVWIAALALRVKALAAAAAVALFAASAFGFLYFLLPQLRYRRFLVEMGQGLLHEMEGTVASVADAPEMQDGARVLRVHLALDGGQDERIVYLNASKRDAFPGVGAHVRLRLYGRHITEATGSMERGI